VVLSLFAEVISNDKPFVVRYNGDYYFPMVKTYPETTFGGDFPSAPTTSTPSSTSGSPRAATSRCTRSTRTARRPISYYNKDPFPAPPSATNWLGTDDRGRDLLAQLIYGFRVSVLFALALTAIGTGIGILTGAVQGFFAGRTDLLFQRSSRFGVDARALPADHLQRHLRAQRRAAHPLLSLFG
jgi:microcin C transport system permease protein